VELDDNRLANLRAASALSNFRPRVPNCSLLHRWLDNSKAKWTLERIAAYDERRRAKASVVHVGDPQQKPVPGASGALSPPAALRP
jgi:hypothetical protein